ncbi:MAG TPA: alpha/beta hydrolase [Pseudonocardiaceae bacterium]
MPDFEVDSVQSSDGTVIGFRRLGHGPAVIAVHGGAQAAQNFMSLAAALADSFTVYLPDRRGRGLSGPAGEHYGLDAETQDLAALVEHSGAERVFGLSSGALICLYASLSIPGIRRLALYEPPLSINHSTPVGWVTRYERELAQGKLGSAMLTVIHGTQTAPPMFRFIPRFVLAPLLNSAARRGVLDRRAGGAGGADNPEADVHPSDLIPTMRYDAQLVSESEGTFDRYRAVTADVLLLGGSQSARYLKNTLVSLAEVLPHARLVTLPGVGHIAADNDGKPELVADQLRTFFTASD